MVVLDKIDRPLTAVGMTSRPNELNASCNGLLRQARAAAIVPAARAGSGLAVCRLPHLPFGGITTNDSGTPADG